MGEIDIINYFLGSLFILLGFLISKYPNLIAGYNTMSKDEKENFDIKGFGKLLRNTLIGCGIFIIISSLIFYFLSWDIGKIFLSILPGLFLAIFLVYKSRDYSGCKSSVPKSKGSKCIYFVLAFNFIFLGVLVFFFIYATKSTKILISNEKIQISGFYAFDISIKDVNSFVITNTLPKVLLRTKGLGLGSIKKGFFKLENYGVCKLFLESYDTPYLKIVYLNDKLVYINFKDKSKTTTLYNELLKAKNTDKSKKLTIP